MLTFLSPHCHAPGVLRLSLDKNGGRKQFDRFPLLWLGLSLCMEVHCGHYQWEWKRDSGRLTVSAVLTVFYKAGDPSPSIQGSEETRVDNKPGRGDGGIGEGFRGGENEMRRQMVTTAEQTAPRASQGTPACHVMRDSTSRSQMPKDVMPSSGHVPWEQGMGQRNQEERNGRGALHPSCPLECLLCTSYKEKASHGPCPQKKCFYWGNIASIIPGRREESLKTESGCRHGTGPPQLPLTLGTSSSLLEHWVMALFLWHSDHG